MVEVRSGAELGKAIKRARYAQGVTQRELARRLGASQRYVTDIERGGPRLFAERLFAALHFLGLRLETVEPDPVDGVGVARIEWPIPLASAVGAPEGAAAAMFGRIRWRPGHRRFAVEAHAENAQSPLARGGARVIVAYVLADGSVIDVDPKLGSSAAGARTSR